MYKSEKYVEESDSEEEYLPPKHFRSYPTKEASISGKDKQVWLIKHPKDFKFNIKKLPINFKSARSTLDVDSKKYQIIEQLTQQDDNKFQIFKGTGSKLVASDIKVNKVYNISESVEIPVIDFKKVKVERSDVPKVSGLKMRHFPTGYEAEDFKKKKK